MADDTVPTSAELQDLSLVANKLYQLDTNRLKKNVEYRINVGVRGSINPENVCAVQS